MIGNTVFCDPHHGCLVRVLIGHRVDEVKREIELICFRCIGDRCQLVIGIEYIRDVLSVYRVLNCCQIEIGLVVFYIRSLNSLFVGRAGCPLFRIENDRVECAVLAAESVLVMRCSTVEEDGVTRIQDLGVVTEHDLQAALCDDVQLLTGVGNKFVRRVQGLFRIRDGDLERLTQFVSEKMTETHVLVTCAAGDRKTLALSGYGIFSKCRSRTFHKFGDLNSTKICDFVYEGETEVFLTFFILDVLFLGDLDLFGHVLCGESHVQTQCFDTAGYLGDLLLEETALFSASQ